MRPGERTRKNRKLYRKMPSGGTKRIAKKRKRSDKVKCAICKKRLQGTTSRRTAKTEKHPTRKFGGNLCAKCAAKAIKIQARVGDKSVLPENVEPRFKRYVI